MIKYKGYSIWNANAGKKFARPDWHVGTVQNDGRMITHATGYPSCLSAKRGADAHFGRL